MSEFLACHYKYENIQLPNVHLFNYLQLLSSGRFEANVGVILMPPYNGFLLCEEQSPPRIKLNTQNIRKS